MYSSIWFFFFLDSTKPFPLQLAPTHLLHSVGTGHLSSQKKTTARAGIFWNQKRSVGAGQFCRQKKISVGAGHTKQPKYNPQVNVAVGVVDSKSSSSCAIRREGGGRLVRFQWFCPSFSEPATPLSNKMTNGEGGGWFRKTWTKPLKPN